MNGGRIERLATVLGRTDVEVTRRYGLRVVLLPEEEFHAVGLDRPDGTAAGANGLTLAEHPQREKAT